MLVPFPLPSTVTLTFVIEESGAVTITVCVELAGKLNRVIVKAEPMVPDIAVIIGEPVGASVDREPMSSGELPLVFIVVMTNVCQAEAVRPAAVYEVTFPTSTDAPASTLTQYLVMADPPL